MLRFLAIVGTLCAVLSGCVSTADVTSALTPVGVISEEKATFDDATIVRMSPAFLYREGAPLGVPIRLGAVWSDKTPDQVALILAYSSNIASGRAPYINFEGLDINIDGRISEYDVGGLTTHDSSVYNTASRTVYTYSRHVVVIPRELLESMLTAKDCRLRIRTNGGYEDAQFSIERIPGGQATAIVPMRDFMSRIESNLARAR